MALLRIQLFALVVILASCTDSQLEGVPLIDLDGRAETDVAPDTDLPPDSIEPDTGVDTVIPDTVIPDTVSDTLDTLDTFDTVDTTDTTDTTGCTSNEACRAVLGDLNACQDPVCDVASGQCRVFNRSDCCVAASDCPRLGDPCLANLCPVPGGGCVALNICNPCRIDGDCPSNDPCTTGSCGADGTCSYLRNPACNQCQSDDACSDQVACTKDACIDGRCIHEPAPGCCTADSDCRDDNACTRDFCRVGSGICGFEQIPNCANCTPELCDDFDPCTQDFCTDLGCTHITDPDCRACQGNGQCNDGDECTRDQCVNGRCTHAAAVGPDGAFICACETNEMCDDGDSCTRDFCDGQQCFSFPDPTLPNCSECGGSDCDDLDDCTTDFCDGSVCQHISNPGFPGCAGECSNDMQCPAADQCSKSFCDIQVGSCVTFTVPDCCVSEGQCDDFDPCTLDQCLPDGRCSHQDVPGCGICEALCDDGDVCTFDECRPDTGECFFERIPGCADQCRNDNDCEDTSDCTLNTCEGGICRISAIPNCCRNTEDCRDGNPCTSAFCQQQTGTCIIQEEDCDDNDPCTVDYCNPDDGGDCEHVPDPLNPECRCEPQILWSRRFVTGETPDINIDGSGFGVRWQVDGVRSFSPTQSLRYGDEQGEDYSTNFRTFGRATGPTLDVPSNASAVRLDFMVYMDIDEDPDKDSLRARVLYGNQNAIVWDRVSIGPESFGRWFPVSVELPDDVIGEQIQIRFVFDSLDGDGNNGQGVFVDDIIVQTICAP